MEKRNPLVSVVIPVYNVEQYLRACLDSVVNQTYSFMRIIIIDDGSTDSSGTICDEYKRQDRRVKVIHQKNHGLGYSRNIGINESNGEYLIFLDSDDYWRLDTIEKLVCEAEKKSLQVLVFSAKPFFDGVNQFKCVSYKQESQNRIVKTGLDSIRYAKEHSDYYPQACLRLYRLDYVKKLGFKFDEGIIHEDENFSFVAYAHAERVECIGETFYYRRYRAGSIMMDSNLIESVNGFTVSIISLISQMDKRKLSFDERELYLKQLKSYVVEILTRYREAKQAQSNITSCSKELTLAHRISYEAASALALLCEKKVGFPWYYRLIYRNFHSIYLVWRIRTLLLPYSQT